jgi:exodeoxyribonuclease VII small subunit
MAKREQTKSAAAVEPSFEAQLASLERIVRELERGELPLEQSLELFEQGVRLSRECQERLNEAERRIELLLRGGDGVSTIAVPFGADELVEDEDADDDESVF